MKPEKSRSYLSMVELNKEQSLLFHKLGHRYCNLIKNGEWTTDEQFNKLFSDIYSNNKTLLSLIDEVEDIDIDFIEKMGFPEVSKIIEKAKNG